MLSDLPSQQMLEHFKLVFLNEFTKASFTFVLISKSLHLSIKNYATLSCQHGQILTYLALILISITEISSDWFM